MKRLITSHIMVFLFTIALVLAACGGGGSGGGEGGAGSSAAGGDQGAVNGDGGGSGGTTSSDGGGSGTAPVIAGFDFILSEGDFWEYGWDYEKKTWDSFNGSKVSNAKGSFRVTVGSPIDIGGVSAYKIMTSGSARASESNDLKPRWKYLAVSNNRILASQDGTTLVTVFDALKGAWPGSGFFANFPAGTLFEATPSSISNNYLNEPAYMVQEAKSKSQCSVFPDIGPICGGDYNENLQEQEYYIAGVGPVGLFSYLSMSDMTSQYPWGTSTKINVGLVKSSLRGDSVDYTLEVEPNNQVGDATAITLPAKVKGDSIGETGFGGSTAVSLGETIDETEPNDMKSASQAVSLPAVVTGDIHENDPSSGGSVTIGNYTPFFEDWYQVTLDTVKTLDISLQFAGTGADLDLWLFSYEGTTPTVLGNSYANNIASGNYTEQISKSLPAGTYYVAIDAERTPQGRAAYTLDISAGASSVNVSDWFSFNLAAPAQVTITLTGSPSFVLTDEAVSTVFASSSSTSKSVSLKAGTYLVGVSAAGAYTLEVTSL